MAGLLVTFFFGHDFFVGPERALIWGAPLTVLMMAGQLSIQVFFFSPLFRSF